MTRLDEDTTRLRTMWDGTHVAVSRNRTGRFFPGRGSAVARFSRVGVSVAVKRPV